jgi:hypothetical protein
MGIQVEWDNDDKTVVRWDVSGVWTWTEFYTAQDESNRLIRSVDHTVDIIGNLLGSAGLPANTLTAYRQGLKRSAANRGVIVFVVSSTFLKAMVATFRRINKPLANKVLAASTVEEARALLVERQAARQELTLATPLEAN